MKSIEIGKYTIDIFTTRLECASPVVFTHMDAERAGEVVAKSMDIPYTLAAISGVDWEKQLSPWPAKAAFRGGDDFLGLADEHISELTNHIIPRVYNELDTPPTCNAILGYSLDGLFALYTLYKSSQFDYAASVSGSLWYDGFIEYMEAHDMRVLPKRVYLSLGDKEKNTRNARLSTVYDNTVKVERFLSSKEIKTVFELNSGGHFVDVSSRIAKAIRYLFT